MTFIPDELNDTHWAYILDKQYMVETCCIVHLIS